LKRGGYAPSKTPLIVTFKDLRAGFASLRLSLITTTLKSGEEILERGRGMGCYTISFVKNLELL